MTVSEMSTRLGYLLNDPNEYQFTSAAKLEALNAAQEELVLELLSFGELSHEILTEITEEESKAVSTSGYALSGLTNRNFLRNGYVNSWFDDPDGERRWVKRVQTSKYGQTANSFLSGTTRSPKCRISNAKYYLLIDVGDYPETVTFVYIGEPYNLAAAASGSGKTQSVATCDLNPMMHGLVVMMAEANLRRMRGSSEDMQQYQSLMQQYRTMINEVGLGAKREPKDFTEGWLRNVQQQTENRDAS